MWFDVKGELGALALKLEGVEGQLRSSRKIEALLEKQLADTKLMVVKEQQKLVSLQEERSQELQEERRSQELKPYDDASVGGVAASCLAQSEESEEPTIKDVNHRTRMAQLASLLEEDETRAFHAAKMRLLPSARTTVSW